MPTKSASDCGDITNFKYVSKKVSYRIDKCLKQFEWSVCQSRTVLKRFRNVEFGLHYLIQSSLSLATKLLTHCAENTAVRQIKICINKKWPVYYVSVVMTFRYDFINE